MKVQTLFIILSSTFFIVNATPNTYKYKNCSPINISNINLGNLSKNFSPEESYITKKYNFSSLPFSHEDEKYCLIINNKNKIIVDAIPTMVRDTCDGEWDRAKNTPVWMADIAGGRGSIDYFYYSTDQNLKRLKKSDKSEIQDVIESINCQFPAYTKDDVQELNDSAFYLYQLGYYNESLRILTYVIKLDSNRTVAYLNIADNYLALNNTDQAKKNYVIYAERMKKSGLLSKIPNRVKKYL